MSNNIPPRVEASLKVLSSTFHCIFYENCKEEGWKETRNKMDKTSIAIVETANRIVLQYLSGEHEFGGSSDNKEDDSDDGRKMESPARNPVA